MTTKKAAFAAMTMAVLLVSACSNAQATVGLASPERAALQTAKPPVQPPPETPNMSGDGPGSLLSVQNLPNISAKITELGATSTRLVYRSTSGTDGKPTEVSGLVVVPAGIPPAGGWPIVSYGHGTTGVEPNCGPSSYQNLLGSDTIVAALILNGFVVVMTDYQGLGVQGSYHPYLDSHTFGNNMIDVVRAARNLIPSLGNKWAAYGVSLGGMAAWAASDVNSIYGQGLDLVGTAALVPVSDMAGLADEAEAGTLTRAQYPLLMYTLNGLSITHPEMNLDDYRHGIAQQDWYTLMQCVGNGADQVEGILPQITPADLKPSTQADVDQLRGWLEDMALPKRGSSSPLLVLYGTADDLILQPWTEKALDKSCALGDTIQYQLRPGEGHGDLDGSASLPWVKARFTGQKALSSCPEKK